MTIELQFLYQCLTSSLRHANEEVAAAHAIGGSIAMADQARKSIPTVA
jgi:hypothetical protein